MNEVLTQAIIEALKKRAKDFGDDFQLTGDHVQIRCFQPTSHKNGDAHPSALYYPGKYVFCNVCGFKEGERKLADRLGIGAFETGLNLTELAEAKSLPLDFLQTWGWRTQRGKDGNAAVLIPWYDENGVTKHAPAYHVRHYVNKDDGTGPRFTWDLPKSTKLRPYGVWRMSEFFERLETSGIPPYIVITESEIDAVTCWLHDIPAVAIGGAEAWKSEWAGYFHIFEKVVIAQEPGKPGIDMVTKIAKDFLDPKTGNTSSEILACPFPDNLKDMNAIHLSVNGNKGKFQETLTELFTQAIPASQILDSAQTTEQFELRRKHDA
jgi:hypothetical protein